MRFHILPLVATILLAGEAHAFTANRVWYEITPAGYIRVTVSYTVPALREFREVHTDFRNRKDAEKFYWSLVRGADFTLSDPQQVQFTEPPMQPRPW